MLIAANKCDVAGAMENVERMKKRFPHLTIIACSAEIEIALRAASKNEVIKYIPGDDSFERLKEANEKQEKALTFIETYFDDFKTTGIQEILNSGVFDFLQYIAVFPGGAHKLADDQGNVLPDVFLLKKGSTALDFAGAIHTDFAKNFIKAIDVRSKRALGAEYILKHRDVLEIAYKR